MDQLPDRHVPGLSVYLLLCSLAALWADLGTIHRLQHGDSLLPVLVSLQRWTPYYWEQDRYGMLIPWLVQPITHPFGNLLAQGFLNIACGLSAFFLLARFMLRDSTYPLVGAAGASAFLILAPAPYRFDYLMDANYGAWMSLGLGGLILIEPRPGLRGLGCRLLALGMIVAAHWIYGAAAVYLGPLVVFRGVFDEKTWSFSRGDLADVARRLARSESALALALLALGFLAGTQLATLAKHHPTSYARIATAEWPQAWASMFGTTWRALAPGSWPLALGVGAGLALVASLVRGQGSLAAVPWREAASLIATALLLALFVGTRRWVQYNVYAPRYLLPSAILVQAALTMLIVVPICRRGMAGAGPGRKWSIASPALAGTLLLLGVAVAYGTPSPRRVRADLERFGTLTPDLIDAGCTHLAGDYWTVWPTVFHVNLTYRERGVPKTLWGVTFRAQPTSERWWHSPQERRCACIPLNDPFGENWLSAFGFARFREVERRGTIRVLRQQAREPENEKRP